MSTSRWFSTSSDLRYSERRVVSRSRLHVEERVQRVEPLLVQREVVLERLQVERDVADARLERPDPRRVVVDLAAERLLLLALPRQRVLQRGDLRVDLVLASCVVAERRRRHRKQEQECECDSPHTESFTFGSATPAANRAHEARPPPPA